ncbi:hypothetical protein N7492_003091 [Penicillium capsulatum]|uniref:Uncharacterized protein n=1 Tax=Penicillium capsulatum TaxID=69766 RepID=A0A9W9IQD1_9EURO|nr:hypothetical protein N7492_003091 [Penicillium capsulatum]KAJ6122318.1 hypothetical protein N7512_004783 [Penicillium capsulatum]
MHLVLLAESNIVMAEQSSRDVVDQTLSGGEPSPSGVPASTNDKHSAGGDVGETEHITTSLDTELSFAKQPTDETRETLDPQAERTGDDKDAGASSTDSSKQGSGLVASRALELNGVASASDGGDDTASQGGSESDTSRADGRHHTRTGSVKKPATFKPVSFAKFAVPKAPGAPAPPKVPEKVPSASTTPLGTPQPSSRPRLVAKTTAGMRDSFSKTGPGGAKPGGSGPDPNQVWNKNRPAQPAPPKHLTDEELKQQYGIHMTSRIQGDSGGTEAKWADIDDDEDDWAPETIEWTDGTKVTLTHNEPTAPQDQSREELSGEPLVPEPTATGQDSVKIAAPKPTTSIGPNPTVLRLGANAERQAKAASISSKGPNDRLPSGSTSPAPPAKSPWATLPPVERVSPVNPSMPPPPQVPSQPRVPSSYPPRDDAYQTSLPPKEIAADDFNRTWREAPSGAPRELYNSRSGRYEPVAETRRPSWRHDQGPRAPAVLQRPTHADPSGPAEPSAAFQTHRSSHHPDGGVGWTRRRTSSNVSGGSGQFARRMSWTRPEAPPRYAERRGSQASGIADPGWASHPSVVSDGSPVEQQQPPTPIAPKVTPATVPQEDPVVLQERIMKEKRLEARQRRLEQEEKEKAARDERIRQKLAALGPPPDKNKRKDSEARKGPVPTSPSAIHSPPKPPVPEPTGEPKQYGMMKVHHPDAVKKLVAANERERAAEKPVEKTSPHLRRAPSPHREVKRDAAPTTNLPPPPPESQPEDSQWRGNLSVTSSYSPWSTKSNLAPTPPSVNNPWKPLSSDRTLGNGIFDPSLGGFPSREISLRNQLGLDQPTMPSKPLTGSQESPSVPSLPSPENRPTSYDPLSPIGRPGPIGPPSSQWQQEPGRDVLGAWNNFHAVAAKREAEDAERYAREYKARRDRPVAPNLMKHTWKQVHLSEDGTQRRLGKATEVVKKVNPVNTDNASPPNPLTALEAPADGLSFIENNARPIANVPARSSRFFPHATEQPKRSAAEKSDHPRSPSPPPPDEISSHPAYINGSGRPLVHLPTPKPVVKLPPKALAAAAVPTTPVVPTAPPTFASMAAAPPRVAPAPTTAAISWQEKINGLFGKKTTVEKKSSPAVTSATKEPLDVQLPATAVSVSLPTAEQGVQTGDGDVAVQQVEEAEEIFEDREPGSQPGVRVPNMAPPAAWLPPAAPSSRLGAKGLKSMQVHSVEPFMVGMYESDASGNMQVLLRLPGALAPKSFSLPQKAATPKTRHRAPANVKPRKFRPKPRENVGNNTTTKKPAMQTNASSSSPRHQSRNTSWVPRTRNGSN